MAELFVVFSREFRKVEEQAWLKNSTRFFPSIPAGIPNMKFIELTGQQLQAVITEGEITTADLRKCGVADDTIVRVNEQGDIEVRRAKGWDVIGGLLGDYEQRLQGITGRFYA